MRLDTWLRLFVHIPAVAVGDMTPHSDTWAIWESDALSVWESDMWSVLECDTWDVWETGGSLITLCDHTTAAA